MVFSGWIVRDLRSLGLEGNLEVPTFHRRELTRWVDDGNPEPKLTLVPKRIFTCIERLPLLVKTLNINQLEILSNMRTKYAEAAGFKHSSHT